MSAHPLAAVAARRGRVLAAVGPHVAGPVDGGAAGRAAQAAVRVLPSGCQYGAVYRSLLPLIGTTPDAAVVRRLAWAIAADSASLRAGRPVWPAAVPRDPAPAVLQILATRRLPDFAGRPDPAGGFRVRCRLRISVGRGAPAEFDVVWGSRYIHYLAVHPTGLGFARPPRGAGRGDDRPVVGRPYQHYETLVGMLVRASVRTDADARPAVDAVRCPPGLAAFNRALTEMRWRATFACPFGYTHPCHACPKGQPSCPAACRPLDLVTGPCRGCGRADAEADPYWAAGVCRRCDAAGKRPF